MMLRCETLATANIDEEKRTIEGYVVISRGELRDFRDMTVDEETMRQVVALGNQTESGIKVRWTHPNFSDDHLGKYLGRATNFRVDGDNVRADITFAKAAELSPVFNRDPVKYILALASEDPAAFATSIYFHRDAAAMIDLYELMEEDQPVPIRLSALLASDIVDEGAAADTFFKSAAPSGTATPEGKEITMPNEDKKQEEAAALAREEARKAEGARLERLQQAFDGKDAEGFILDQFKKGNDVTEAKAEWADVLAERLAAKDKEHAEALKNASKQKDVSDEDGEQPIGNNGDGTEVNASEAFEAKIDDYRRINVGSTRTEAMRAVIAKNPSLYRDAFGLHNIFQSESA